MEKRISEQEDKKYQDGLRIITIAAFCFAIVSWWATAQGLKIYVFSGAVEAGLISFGVQSILFVFNLRFPYYFSTTKSHYKWVLLLFYCIILLFSSCLSFVYICNDAVYNHNTGYVDDNTVLTNEYRIQLNEGEKYANESVKALRLLASRQLGELLKEISGNGTDTGQKTKEMLEEECSNAEREYQEAVSEYDTAQEKVEDAKQKVEDARAARFWAPKSYNDAMNDLELCRDEKKEKEKEKKAAESAYNTAKKRLEEYAPTQNELAEMLLIDFLKGDPKDSEIEERMDQLKAYVVNMEEGGTIPDGFGSVAEQVQSLDITVQKYLEVRNVLNDENQNGFTMLKKELENGDVEIPDPALDDFEIKKNDWEESWTRRYRNLEDAIQNLPLPESTNFEMLEETAIDKGTLQNYDMLKRLDEMDDLVRMKLTDINVIEKTFGLFISKYRFTACCSLIIAFFLDISSLLVGLFAYALERNSQSQPCQE